jgi:hypothetical protein
VETDSRPGGGREGLSSAFPFYPVTVENRCVLLREAEAEEKPGLWDLGSYFRAQVVPCLFAQGEGLRHQATQHSALEGVSEDDVLLPKVDRSSMS